MILTGKILKINNTLYTENHYNIGELVWVEYLTPISRKAEIIDICDDDITIRFNYWGCDNTTTVRDFQLTHFSCDDYINDIKKTMNLYNYNLNDIESYLRKIKLLKINNIDNYNTEIDDEDSVNMYDVFKSFDVKYIEGYILRTKQKELK